MFSPCSQLVRRAAKGMLAGNWAGFHQDFICADGSPGNISILMNQQSEVGDGLPAGGVNVQHSGKVGVPTSGRCQLIQSPPNPSPTGGLSLICYSRHLPWGRGSDISSKQGVSINYYNSGYSC